MDTTTTSFMEWKVSQGQHMSYDRPERRKEAVLGGTACCLKAKAGKPVLIDGRCIAALELVYPTRPKYESVPSLAGYGL